MTAKLEPNERYMTIPDRECLWEPRRNGDLVFAIDDEATFNGNALARRCVQPSPVVARVSRHIEQDGHTTRGLMGRCNRTT